MQLFAGYPRDVDPTEDALRRARELRERASALDQRTYELVEKSDELLQQIDEHTRRAGRSPDGER